MHMAQLLLSLEVELASLYVKLEACIHVTIPVLGFNILLYPGA